ncbi:MAG: hypothetical protein ABIR30_06225 [Chitinophagaceae bacterium]
MKENELITLLAKELGIAVTNDNSILDREFVAAKINELIQSDFQQLVTLLYRVDVSEVKLKKMLRDNPGTDAGLIITDMLVERQAEKIRSRQQERQRDNDIDEEEKW